MTTPASSTLLTNGANAHSPTFESSPNEPRQLAGGTVPTETFVSFATKTDWKDHAALSSQRYRRSHPCAALRNRLLLVASTWTRLLKQGTPHNIANRWVINRVEDLCACSAHPTYTKNERTYNFTAVCRCQFNPRTCSRTANVKVHGQFCFQKQTKGLTSCTCQVLSLWWDG